MSISVKKIALTEHIEPLEHSELSEPLTGTNFNLIGNVEVPCTVRIGTLALTNAELQQLKLGQILELQQKTHEPIDLVLNDHVIARGELVSCDECFAIQITELCS
jgi:flagellar motor switch protein FliN/FliY